MTEPTIVHKRAIDVTPYRHALWCTVGGGEPFANTIVYRKWDEGGSAIVFMLDSHNFCAARPDELMGVVEIQPVSAAFAATWDERDAARMRRPTFDEGEAY
jgi:hypothetical protein